MNKAFTKVHLGIFKIIDKSSKKLLLLDKNFITVFGELLNILKKISGIISGFLSKTLKKGKNRIVVYDVPAAVHGSRLNNYIKKVNMVVVPVMPSPIDMKAAKEFIQSVRSMGPVIRNKIKVGLVANRCRAYTNIFSELDNYLLKEKGIKYITAFRDNTNYIKSAKSGLGIFEMGEAATAQDREEWKPLVRWLGL